MSSNSYLHGTGYVSDNVFSMVLYKDDGYLIFTYDVGTGPQRMVEQGHKFNDGRYHTVQFIRTGSTATLRVDNLPLKHTGSLFSGYFYEQAYIWHM